MTTTTKTVARFASLGLAVLALLLPQMTPVSAAAQSQTGLPGGPIILNVRSAPEEFIARAAMGDLAEVRSFLNAGVDVNARNARGMTALIAAAEHGHLMIVKTLIENGADVHLKNKMGATALMLATLLDYPDVVQILRKAGAKE